MSRMRQNNGVFLYLYAFLSLFLRGYAMPWNPVTIFPPRTFDVLNFTRNSQVFEMVADPKTVYVDVRDERELLKPPYLNRPFIYFPIRELGGTAALRESKELQAMKKNTPIVVFSNLFGLRARRAKTVMAEMGFKKVCNGGSVDDVLDAIHFHEFKEHKRSPLEKILNMFGTIGSDIVRTLTWPPPVV